MARSIEQAVTLARTVLADDEQVRAAAEVDYNGSLAPNLSVVNSAIVDLDAPPPPIDPLAVVAFPTASRMVVVLTPRRALVWSRGFGGKPKAYLGEVPIDAIDVVKTATLPTGRGLRLTMRSGARVEVVVARGVDGDAFVDALLDAVGPG